MIDNILLRVRAAALSFAVAVAVSASLFAIASPAVADAVVPNLPSLHETAPGLTSDVVLAQQAKPAKAAKSPRKSADSDEETATVRDFLKEKMEWFKSLPGLGTLVAIMPQLWTPLRAALLLIFLGFFVLYHFRRQQRNLLEAEQNREPSAAEAEFGIVANPDGKEVSP